MANSFGNVAGLPDLYVSVTGINLNFASISEEFSNSLLCMSLLVRYAKLRKECIIYNPVAISFV